jgi:hypothetical protein
MIEWRPCPGFPSYEISEFGAIRRTVYAKGFPAGRLLADTCHPKGYITYQLSNRRVRKTRYAHRLVCEAWHGPCPPDKEHAAHNDGNRRNNHFSNLRWATRAENEADKFKHGTNPAGERHPSAKLTWETVCSIRAEYTGRVGQAAELAERYGTTKDYIKQVVYRRTWKAPPELAA